MTFTSLSRALPLFALLGCNTASEDGASSCGRSDGSFAIEIEISDIVAATDFDATPCTVDGSNFDCDGTRAPVSYGGVGEVPWVTGDDVLITLRPGGTTLESRLFVHTPDGLLLAAIGDALPFDEPALTIELIDLACPEDENRVVHKEAMYIMGDASASLVGNAETSLETRDGTYRIRQQSAGTSQANPDSSGFARFAVVRVEG